MQWLSLQPKASSSVRFRAMLESGRLLDEIAVIVQSQVIADKGGASVRNRKTIPLYHLRGDYLQHHENMILETGQERSPLMDSRYILEDSINLYKGIRHRSEELLPDSPMRSVAMKVASIAGAVIVFLAMIWLAATLNAGPDAVAAATTAQEQTSERVEHGSVDDLADVGAAVPAAEDQPDAPDDGAAGRQPVLNAGPDRESPNSGPMAVAATTTAQEQTSERVEHGSVDDLADAGAAVPDGGDDGPGVAPAAKDQPDAPDDGAAGRHVFPGDPGHYDPVLGGPP